MMRVEWTDSADKHGISHEDALHAVLRHLYRVSPYGEPREPGGPPPELFVGPGTSGRWLEVIAVVARPGILLIFHVMEARATVIEEARRSQQ
jgi:hypothetical protein